MRSPRELLSAWAAAWIVLGSLAAWMGLTDAMPSFRRWSQPPEEAPARLPVLDTGS